jgi:septal ring factor EnvC (AmiA/AmiB activator)
MITIPPDVRPRPLASPGIQPIAIAAASLLLIVAGIGAIFLWRVATGYTPEQERIASGRQVQARVVETSEQIMQRTKGLELTQQESIDQLQALQDQLHELEKLVIAQRSETKRLSDQVGELNASFDGLRQSFAQAQPPEAAERPAARAKPAARSHRSKAKPRGKSRHKRTKSHR